MKANQPAELKRPSLLVMFLDAMGMMVFLGLGIGTGALGYTKRYAYYGLEMYAIWTFSIVCVALGIWFLIRLMRANRRFLDVARLQILNDPENILMQWSVDGHEYVIARQGLVLDNTYHGFNEFHERLRVVFWQKEDTLRLVISVFAGRRNVTKSLDLPIPYELKEKANEVAVILNQRFEKT